MEKVDGAVEGAPSGCVAGWLVESCSALAAECDVAAACG